MTPSMDSYYAAWAALDWLTEKRLELVLNHFYSLENAWNAIQISDVLRIDPRVNIEEWSLKKSKIYPEQEQEKLLKMGVKILYLKSGVYPQKLKQISGAPVFLYCRGDWEMEYNTALAVVGTRSPTHYGKQVTEFFVSHLGLQMTIVSGLAYGIDTLAHETCVQQKSPTIAVLGNGIDTIYPPENRQLAERIIESGGCILSEFSPGVSPNNFNFPRRNRIISGLSLGTLVIEGQEKSGSLITAQYALEQNREVFAVPGNIFSPQSKGTNLLIQKGEAKLVLSPDDILQELSLEQENHFQNAQQSMPLLSNEESLVYNTLSHEGIDLSEICNISGISSTKITATLTLLELKGFVQNMGNGLWVKLYNTWEKII